MQVQPYLFFEGRCEEALEFYAKAIGAKVTMKMRFSENPEPQANASAEGCAPGADDGNKIMHAAFTVGDSMLMASDGRNSGQPNFQGISLALTAADDAEAQRLFAALSEGGQAQMPLTKTFFSTAFGMVADRFGIMWMVMAAPQ